MDGVRTMRQKTREQRRKLMRKQKLYGLVFVLLSIFVVIMCMTGKTAEDRDATAIVLLLPPKERGWIDQKEAAQVKNMLELDARTDIELQNIRDMAVMLYGRWSSSSRENGDYEEMDAYMDAMSAICAVVDDIKMRRGLGV